jgi:hypothetical protein
MEPHRGKNHSPAGMKRVAASLIAQLLRVRRIGEEPGLFEKERNERLVIGLARFSEAVTVSSADCAGRRHYGGAKIRRAETKTAWSAMSSSAYL